MTLRHAQRGYTMIEVAVVTVITMATLATVGQLLGATDGLTEETRAHGHATREHRRNLMALAGLLMSADVDSLAGFDQDGTSEAPRFQRVNGADLVERTYEEEERLVWMPMTRPVDGVERPGNVWLLTSGSARLVAARVPEGGFQVRQEGPTLAVRLTTYYVSDGRRMATVTSETAISLRN
jgi:hypothetical protein